MGARSFAPAGRLSPAFLPAMTGLLQRRCACGGQCARCNGQKAGGISAVLSSRSPSQPSDAIGSAPMGASRLGHAFGRVSVHEPRDWSDRPAKAVGALPQDENQEKPRPTNGSATIQCNGSGDYEIVYGTWARATCGTKDCVTMHESSHMADWKGKWPTGCKGQPKGYLPKGDPPDSPLMTAGEYKAFLKESECTAHTVDLECAEALPQPAGCKKIVQDYIKLTKDQKAHWCPLLSRKAKVGLGLLAGAGIGALIGGFLGAAAVGAGVGALVGGVAGLLL